MPPQGHKGAEGRMLAVNGELQKYLVRDAVDLECGDVQR